MHAKTLAATTALLVAVPFAAAAGPSHSYLDGAYKNMDGDLDGFAIEGSLALTPAVHLYGGYDNLRDSPVRLERGKIALGWNYSITPATDFVARGGWMDSRLRVSGVGSTSDDGLVAQAGVRSMLTNVFELNGFVQHADVHGGDTSLLVGGVYGFTPQMGISGGVEITEDDTIYQVGVRVSW